jgi:hypothetical protein
MRWSWLVLGLLLTYAGLFVASSLESTDCANCWQATATLSELYLAQEKFRNTDADRNGIKDYWRTDVAGLYTLAPDGEPLKFIGLSTAQADRRPAAPVPGGRVTKCAYWFETLGFGDEKKPDPMRFAYCAWPDVPYRNEWTFMVDHHGVIYGKRIAPYWPPEFYPADPTAEGWVTLERVRKIRWKESHRLLWWVRFWNAL